MTRAEFLAAVEKAEKKALGRRRPRIMAEGSLTALAGAREADPMRGVHAARLVPRCGKVKTTDRRPCKSPCVRGGTRCWRHGGLKQNPSHPGNIRRLLNGIFAAQAAYRIELKTQGEFWDLLTVEEKQDIQSHFIPKARSDRTVTLCLRSVHISPDLARHCRTHRTRQCAMVTKFGKIGTFEARA